ncbi:MAG: hypothetical protein A3K06_00050 [Candidatus Doudnabacteria bacterium RIFCSPHIGHO2_01_52_17]|uniref:Uncharacterized protein n=1 Tax=Candidatus Doudnabacteria bacterium RIFCSPHIGHO2_01_52_17 TaxID=1817820 RepID=A0A1F5NAD7_9BACT|nr:MAG: hypothetical protein A3K06_00050 [Candidatus Doudnabacteria bacterium RIFCSPHIGHO2_01_52_17]
MKKETTIDDLAVMVKNGFEGVTGEMNSRFDQAHRDMNSRFGEVNHRLDLLEQGQEQIKLKLDNVAYRFELIELQRRVEMLEKKAGIK